MDKNKIQIVAAKLLAMLITKNPSIGIPLVRYFASFIIEQVLILAYKNVDLYFELAKIEDATSEQRKNLEVVRLEYQIARIKGDPNEIKIHEDKFKKTFDAFINLRY